MCIQLYKSQFFKLLKIVGTTDHVKGFDWFDG